MRIPSLQNWRGELAAAGFLMMYVGIPLLIAGYLIKIFPSMRVPGEYVLNIGFWLAILGALAFGLSQVHERLRKDPTGRPNLGAWVFLVATVASWGLVFLATQGTLGGSTPFTKGFGFLPAVESWVLAFCLLYTLVYLPAVVRWKLPFERASEQALRLVPAGLAAGAAIVSGLYCKRSPPPAACSGLG